MSHPAFTYYRRLTRVVEYVAARVGDPLTLAEVAKVACLEQKYFSAYFHSKVGITFTHWLQGVRVMRAQQLLRRSDLSVAQVAFEGGFGDVRTLERAFKQHVGMTPREYRTAVRRNHE